MAGLADWVNPSAQQKQNRYERSKGWMDSVDDFIAPVTGAISGAVYDFEDAVTPFIPPELRHLPLSPSDIGGGALTLAQMINPLPMIDQAMTDSGDAGDGTQTVVGADGKWYDRELTLDERAGLATGSAVEATAAVLPAAIYGRVMGGTFGSVFTEALTGMTTSASAANTVAGADISKIISNAEAGQPVIRLDDKYRGDGPMASTIVSRRADGRPINNPTYSVRVTQQSQIDDMIASGVIRSKEGGHKDGNSQLYFNTQDTPNPTVDGYRDGKKASILAPNINNDQLMIVAPTHWTEDSVGPIPLDRLLHVWKYVDGKAVDVLPDMIKKNRQYGDGEGLAAAKAKQTGKPAAGDVTRRTFNKGAAAVVVAGGAAVGAKNTIGDVLETVGKRAVKVSPKVIQDFGGRLGEVLTRIRNEGDRVDFHDMEAGASQGGGNLIPNDYQNLRELLPKDADGNLLPRDNGRGGFYEGEPEFGEVHDWMMENDIGGPYKAYWDDANAYEGSHFGAQTELVDLAGEVDEAGFRESLKELSSDELEDMSVELDDFAANRWAEDNNFEPQDRQKINQLRMKIADEVGRRDNLGDEVMEEVAGEDTFFKDVINTRKARLEKEAAEAAEELAKQQADQVWFEKYLPVGWKTGGF